MGKTLYLEKITSYKLEDKIRGFKAHLVASDRGGSVVSYIGDIQKFGNWLMQKYGSFNASAVNPLDLVEYRKYLQDNGGRSGGKGKPTTVNRALISLKIFFGWLVKNKEIKDNPAGEIKQVAVATTPAPKWLDRNEQNRFFREVRESSTRDEAIVGLMLHAGLRVSCCS
ncbi:MAG: tyrosine-type recombinase/integrase [Mobilitalea sp.]